MKFDVPILYCAQRTKIMFPFNGIPVNMTNTGSIRTKLHFRSLGEGGLNSRELFKNTAARPVEVGILGENDVDE